MSIITVSQLNNYLFRYVEQNIHLSDLWIKAELSNVNAHYSGHIYMTLKDEKSSIKAIIFKSIADKMDFDLKNGMQVVVHGKLSVYEREGLCQLYVNSIIPDGVGQLYLAYEKLKIKLERQGLFDKKIKKGIPKYPRNIGVITSIKGAALRDIINVISRRYPICDICIYPVQVQGIDASESIVNALEYFESSESCDLVIIARGGGSIEDLWAFNEEKTVKAIFLCTKPTICGIGHETDYTLADFAADLRAPTPSAAAELATPSMDMIIQKLNGYEIVMYNMLLSVIKDYYMHFSEFSFKRLNDIFNSQICSQLNYMDIIYEKLNEYMLRIYQDKLQNLSDLSLKINSLNPEKILKRGYMILADSNKNTLKLRDINVNDELSIIFPDGYAKCIITEVNLNGKL